MVKRIVSASLICLVLFSMSAIAFNIQSAKACEYVVLHPDDHVTLTFLGETVGVGATADETDRYPPPPPPLQDEVRIAASETPTSDGFIGPVWDIQVTGTFTGQVRVRINYESESNPTEILQTDIVLGDVNADGKVNFKDLLIITQALCSVPGNRRWNPYCDLNGDNKITLKDLCIAINHLGQRSEWTSLGGISWGSDEHGNYIEGETSRFSIFGVR